MQIPTRYHVKYQLDFEERRTDHLFLNMKIEERIRKVEIGRLKVWDNYVDFLLFNLKILYHFLLQKKERPRLPFENSPLPSHLHQAE